MLDHRLLWAGSIGVNARRWRPYHRMAKLLVPPFGRLRPAKAVEDGQRPRGQPSWCRRWMTPHELQRQNDASPLHHPVNHRWRPLTVAPTPRSATDLTTLGFRKRSNPAPILLPPVSSAGPAGPFTLVDQQSRQVFIFSAVDGRSKQLSAVVSATVHPLPPTSRNADSPRSAGAVASSWEQLGAVGRSSTPFDVTRCSHSAPTINAAQMRSSRPARCHRRARVMPR